MRMTKSSIALLKVSKVSAKVISLVGFSYVGNVAAYLEDSKDNPKGLSDRKRLRLYCFKYRVSPGQYSLGHPSSGRPLPAPGRQRKAPYDQSRGSSTLNRQRTETAAPSYSFKN